MTLATAVLISKPVNAEELFRFVREDLLGGTDANPWRHERDEEGERYLSMNAGLASIVDVSFRPDGPIKDEEYGSHPDGTWFVKLWLDTAYGYEAPNGGHCNDLHAWLVQRVGQWLYDHGCDSWRWYHELEGEWYGQHTSPNGVLGNVALGALVEDNASSHQEKAT